MKKRILKTIIWLIVLWVIVLLHLAVINSVNENMEIYTSLIFAAIFSILVAGLGFIVTSAIDDSILIIKKTIK
jgi:hypothetical protein